MTQETEEESPLQGSGFGRKAVELLIGWNTVSSNCSFAALSRCLVKRHGMKDQQGTELSVQGLTNTIVASSHRGQPAEWQADFALILF